MFSENADEVGVCILSAGLAKRLEPISSLVAKPAFPLCGGPPIAERWVRQFVQAGIQTLAMNLHKVPDSIYTYFGDGARFLADISYIYEDQPTGTLGGAINMVKAFHQNGFFPKRVFIPSGDIVSGVQTAHLKTFYTEHVRNNAVFSMLLAPIPMDRRKDFGTTILEGFEKGETVLPGTYAKVLDFLEKDPNSPSIENNASLYLIETDFLRDLEKYLTQAKKDQPEPCYDFGAHVLMGIIGRVKHLDWLTRYKDRLFGYEPGVLWYDIGSKRDYLEVNKAALRGDFEIELPYTRYPWGWMGESVSIDFNHVSIVPPVVIGSRCTVLPGATIGPNAVIGDGWVIHRGASIQNSVLWPYYDFLNKVRMKCGYNMVFREVRDGRSIEHSIVTGGIIDQDIRDRTVIALHDGSLDIRSIDWVPEGPRD